MLIPYIIAGGILFFLLQKVIYKLSPKQGWCIFATLYILVSVLCAFYFAPLTEKFSLWQRLTILLAFIIGTVVRVVYYRGRMLADK
ncbi:MAG: hypothetical protein LCH58_10535 [Bacteroidetes bacterium]|uniref:hypothetical protein n=1 Tax=Phnomibacter sp. TaxID=2836217 RepID=UPI002FDCBF2E|nr:hypothetical protein [Bacteroidota bacterium]